MSARASQKPIWRERDYVVHIWSSRFFGFNLRTIYRYKKLRDINHPPTRRAG